jgi:hypothetical protein
MEGFQMARAAAMALVARHSRGRLDLESGPLQLVPDFVRGGRATAASIYSELAGEEMDAETWPGAFGQKKT